MENEYFSLFAIVISDDYAGSYIWKQFYAHMKKMKKCGCKAKKVHDWRKKHEK